MIFYSHNGQVPAPLPHRIILSSGMTRTDSSSFTAEEIADAGYTESQPMPAIIPSQVVTWDMQTISWQVRDKTAEELAVDVETQWGRVRDRRDELMDHYDWMYARYDREARLNLPHAVMIEDLDTYMQALADITLQADPFDIAWPVFQGVNNGT
jgi:hypothetical protein